MSAVSEAVTAYVEAFNAYRTFAITQQATAEGQGASPDAVLFGDSLLKTTNAAVYDIMETTVEVDGAPYGLSDIGIDYGAGNMLTVDETALENALLQSPEIVEALFASRTTSTSAELGVASLPGSVKSGSYTVDIMTDGATGDLVSASIDGVAMDISGTTIVGPEGSAFAGLRLVYTGTTSASIGLTVSQGVADVTMATVDTYTDDHDGLISGKIESLEETIDDKQVRRDDIAASAAAYEAHLVDYYARLEQEIAEADLVKRQLEALLDDDD